MPKKKKKRTDAKPVDSMVNLYTMQEINLYELIHTKKKQKIERKNQKFEKKKVESIKSVFHISGHATVIFFSLALFFFQGLKFYTRHNKIIYFSATAHA